MILLTKSRIMKFSSSVPLLLLIAGMAMATPDPTMTDDLILVPKRTSKPLSVSSPTQAPTFNMPVSAAFLPNWPNFPSFPVKPPVALTPVRAPVLLTDEPTSFPTGAPITPTALPTAAPITSPPSTLSPTAVVSLPTASEMPSLVPSSLQTIAPSVTPAVIPTQKPPTNGNFTSVKVTGLQLSLVNAGTLLEANRWRVQTEKLYNGYFEDITCSVSFVKSEVSDRGGLSINTITFDLLLQSELLVISYSEQYAVEPFEDEPANIQYGNALRKLINFERLSLPVSVPKVPKRTEDGSGNKVYFFEKLGMPLLLVIMAAALSGLFICICCCNCARRQRQLSKPSEEPMSTFRISSDDDISTIGPIEDIVDSELGESVLTEDDYSNNGVDGRTFGRTVISNIGRAMCIAGAAKAEARDDEESDYNQGELMDVFVPPGKLGIIINTPDEGPPVIHVVKETSPVLDQIHVGDKLIAIDDEDVRSMTAVEVSQIISIKSSNLQRKFTIMRPYDIIDM